MGFHVGDTLFDNYKMKKNNGLENLHHYAREREKEKADTPLRETSTEANAEQRKRMEI